MSEEPAQYRTPGRPGLSAPEVAKLCDDMLKRGERPTIEKIRHVLGGSPNTITRLLDDWWESLGARLVRGSAAFERIPAHLALHVEEFFLTVVEEAKRALAADEKERRDAVDKREAKASLRDHVLSLREKELKGLLEQRDRMIGLLEQQLTDKRTLAEKTLATKDALERQVCELSIAVATLQAKLAATLATPRPRVMRQARRPKQPPKRRKAAATKRKSAVAAKRRGRRGR
jgi:hypothetical protein